MNYASLYILSCLALYCTVYELRLIVYRTELTLGSDPELALEPLLLLDRGTFVAFVPGLPRYILHACFRYVMEEKIHNAQCI